jgi:hypothetical protein
MGYLSAPLNVAGMTALPTTTKPKHPSYACESFILQSFSIDNLPIMPFGKTDELAVNTIRTLAVRHVFAVLSLPRHPLSDQPATPLSKSSSQPRSEDV